MELNFAMTTLPTIVLWGIGLVVFVIGALLGYMNMNIDARKKIEAMETKAEIMRAEAEKKLEQVQLLKEQNPGLLGDDSLLRLRKENNRVQVEMDGNLLTTSISAEEKKRLLEYLSYIRPFIESGQPVAQPVVKDEVKNEVKVEVPPVHIPATTPISNEVKPVSIFGGSAPKKLDPQKEFALLSIVQQIDTVLQRKIAGTPLEEQKLHLKESPEGAVEVYIGLQKYPSIDDVPDEKIKSVIRGAISEWENKHIPGL